RRRLRGEVYAALVVFGGGRGRKTHAAAPAQYVGHERQGGGTLDHHRRRQMGGDQYPGRSALPAPPAHGREKILALRREWRAPSTVWNRSAPPAHRGGADRRHERIQCLGGILWRVSAHARGSPRARECQDGAQGPYARGRQGSSRPWHPSKTI